MIKKETMKKNESPWIDGKITNISLAAVTLLGLHGRMIYRSKSMAKPTTIFNANIFDAKAKKIWFGDLEIERDREALTSLCNQIGSIYILSEMDGRFLKKVPTPRTVKNTAIVSVEDGNIAYSESFATMVTLLNERMEKAAAEAKASKTGRSRKAAATGKGA